MMFHTIKSDTRNMRLGLIWLAISTKLGKSQLQAKLHWVIQGQSNSLEKWKIDQIKFLTINVWTVDIMRIGSLSISPTITGENPIYF